MGGSSFERVVVLAGAQDVGLSGITGMTTRSVAADAVAYVVDGPDQSVIRAYRIGADGVPQQIDAFNIPNGMAAGVARDVSIANLGGRDVAVISGLGATGVHLVDLDSDGTFASARALSGARVSDALQGAFVLPSPDGGAYLYGFAADAPAPMAWRVNGDMLEALAPPAPGFETAVAGLAHGASGVLLAASGADHALVSYVPDDQGRLSEVARLGAAQGIGMNAPAAVTTVSAHGAEFAIVGGAGSGTLSVFEVHPEGHLTLRDHVMDGRDSRFDGVTIAESVVVGGRAYVVAAGSDDGVSLFELLPEGRLVMLGIQADMHTLTLDNPSAIALSEAGGVLNLLVSSETEPGLTALRFDPQTEGGMISTGGAMAGPVNGGQFGDLLVGGAADDDLRGGDGADLIADGAGDDILRGGAGADIFVMAQDGGADIIADFQPGIDRIDLSGWTFLRNTTQLQVTPHASGAEIRFGQEVLIVQTADGAPLSAEAVHALDLLGPARYMPPDPLTTAPAQPEIAQIEGTAFADDLAGGAGADTINGYSGDDTLTGGGGDDTLLGGAGHDWAVFSGPLAEYEIHADPDDAGLRVTHAGGAGADGVDWLTGVETALFADDAVDLTKFPDEPGEPPPPHAVSLPGLPLDAQAIWTGGDPHLRTLDGIGYDFHAAGEFVLLRGIGAHAGFEVQARMVPLGQNVTVNQAIAIRTDAGDVMIDVTDATPLSVDGVATPIGESGLVDVGLERLYLAADTYTLVFAGEDGIVNAGDSRVSVTLRADRVDFGAMLDRADFGNRLEGLLGDGDGNPDNDIALSDGTVLERPLAPDDLYGAFSDDWRVKTLDQSLFSYDGGETPDAFHLPDYPADTLMVSDFGMAEVTGARQQAEAAGLVPGTLNFDNAVLDLLVTGGDASYLATALDVQGAGDVVPVMTLKNAQERATLTLSISDAASGAGVDGADVTFVADMATASHLLNPTGAGQYELALGEGMSGQLRVAKALDATANAAITVSDALEALRLAAGLTPSWGAADTEHLLAADLNGDGAVTVADALGILRHSAGLYSSDATPGWAFLPPDLDLSGVDGAAPGAAYHLDVDAIHADQSLDMTAILIGNVDMT